MRPQRLPLLWQRAGRPGSFYAPTPHEPAYLLARVSGARPNQHRHRLLQATAFCILLQPPPRKRTQPVLQSPSQITVSIHAFTQAACAGRAGLSPKRRNPLTKVVICSQPHQESHRRHSLSLFIFLSPYLCLSLSRLSSFSLRGALPLALGLIYIRSPEDTIDTSTCSNGVLPLAISLSSLSRGLGPLVGCPAPLASPRTKRRSLVERRPRGGATKTAALGGGRRRRAFRPRPRRRPPLSHLALERLCRERHELLQGCLRGVFLTRAQ